MMCEAMGCTYTELMSQPQWYLDRWTLLQRAREAAAKVNEVRAIHCSEEQRPAN